MLSIDVSVVTNTFITVYGLAAGHPGLKPGPVRLCQISVLLLSFYLL